MADGEDLICVTCSTQYDTSDRTSLRSCKICDDPRQFVPVSGQSWTTLSDLRKKYKNKFIQDPVEERMWSIMTEPKVKMDCLPDAIRS